MRLPKKRWLILLFVLVLILVPALMILHEYGFYITENAYMSHRIQEIISTEEEPIDEVPILGELYSPYGGVPVNTGSRIYYFGRATPREAKIMKAFFTKLPKKFVVENDDFTPFTTEFLKFNSGFQGSVDVKGALEPLPQFINSSSMGKRYLLYDPTFQDKNVYYLVFYDNDWWSETAKWESYYLVRLVGVF